LSYRCFPHIVNLACKAILAAISALDFNPIPPDEEDDDEEGGTFMDKLTDDPIACLRTLIRVICALSIRRQCFSELTVERFGHDVQLLRDVDTRWSSTCLMIERALFCRPIIVKFLSMPDFEDLRRHYLTGDDWEALQAFYDILSIPHAFQQRLSAEKTPTLCETIRSFSAITAIWKEHQGEHPETSNIIQAGIDKLEEYSERTSLTPAYTVAMCTSHSYLPLS
ncbi:ribonuclease H-like domain-containing protein, partial [Flammula alnicola]